jgi:hypothetical protein
MSKILDEMKARYSSRKGSAKHPSPARHVASRKKDPVSQMMGALDEYEHRYGESPFVFDRPGERQRKAWKEAR